MVDAEVERVVLVFWGVEFYSNTKGKGSRESWRQRGVVCKISEGVSVGIFLKCPIRKSKISNSIISKAEGIAKEKSKISDRFIFKRSNERVGRNSWCLGVFVFYCEFCCAVFVKILGMSEGAADVFQ